MTTFPKRFLRAALAAVLLIAAALMWATSARATCGSVHVTDAWIMKAPPVVKMHAGYLTIENHGEAERALAGVASPAYGRIEMHLSREVDGVATMQHVSQVAVPAGGTVIFRPGGLHLMLMQPEASVAELSDVVLHLTFDDDSTAAVSAVFRTGAPAAGDGPGLDRGNHGPGGHGAGT